MKALIWIIVALVIVGGLAWFLSSDESNGDKIESGAGQQGTSRIIETGSISSDDNIFTEIDNALAELE